MNISVGKKPDKMECRMIFYTISDQFIPGFGMKNGSVLNALIDEFGSLSVNLTAAECVMTHFAVPHIFIRWKSHRCAVSFDLSIRTMAAQPIQCGGICFFYGVTYITFSDTDAIHND